MSTIEIIAVLQATALVGMIISRHHLRQRHAALKLTLNRVASERDSYRWHSRGLASRFPDDPDAIAIINLSKEQ
jgi:hypothetical protein